MESEPQSISPETFVHDLPEPFLYQTSRCGCKRVLLTAQSFSVTHYKVYLLFNCSLVDSPKRCRT